MAGSEESRVLAFLPTLNDASELGRLTQEIQALGRRYQPLVIDDGSVPPIESKSLADGTLIATLPDNYGLGLCTHLAFDHALRSNYTIVVRIDSDGQHPPSLIPEFVAPLDTGDADVVVGRRLNHREGRGPRNFVSGLAKGYIRMLTRVLVGRGAPDDMNSGLMAFNKRAISTLNRCGFERYPEPQIVCLALGLGLRVKTTDMIQEARTEGNSSIGLLQGVQIMYRFTIFALGEMLHRRPRS